MRRLSMAFALVLALALTGSAEAAQSGRKDGQQSRRISVNQLMGADEITGMTVYGKSGREIGEVDRVLLNPKTGKAEALVVSSGEFLGMGGEQVAVPFQAFTVSELGLSLNATEQQFRDAPRYTPNTAYDRDAVGRTYGYWGYPFDAYAWNDPWGWGEGWYYSSDYGLDEDTRVMRPGALSGTTGPQGEQAGQDRRAKAGSGPWVGAIRKMNDSYIFVDKSGVPFNLRGQQGEIRKLEGQRVQVAGSLSGATITVQDVKPLQAGGAAGQQKSQQGATWVGRIDQAGQEYVLVVEGRTYKLEGRKDQLAKLVGQQARVTGTMSGDTVTAQNVRPLQQGGQSGGS